MTAPTSVDVRVAGPGALYLGKVNDEIRFWTLSDSTARLAGKVSIATVAEQPLLINVTLGRGISGVFYNTELPLGNDLRLKFSGALSNEKCPQCTVMMPLTSDSWGKWFGELEGEAKVSGNFALTSLVDQQNQIFVTAGRVTEQIAESEQAQIGRQKQDLKDVYEQMTSATEQGEQILDTSYAQAMAFSSQTTNQSAHDTGVVQNAADAYANFLTNQTPKIQTATNCANVDDWWALEKQLERDLRIDGYPDPLPETPDEDTYQPANREIIIKQYEDSKFPKLQGQMRPCVLNLLGGLYTETEDISFPGSIPDLPKENLVSPTSYETIGNNLETFVNQTDSNTNAFEATQEVNFGKLDKLAAYQAFEKQFESLPKPLLKYVGSQWLQDSPPTGQNANTQKVSTAGIASKTSALSSTSSNCGNTPVVTFNISGVSVLIGTPWNDQVTGDDGKNLIITLAGDDCVDAKGDMDAVFTMSGNDTIYGGDGHGFLFGGKGDDTIKGGKGESYEITIGVITLKFDLGSFISGDAGKDTIYGSENTALDLFGYSDVIMGDGLASVADSGDDVIDGVKGINLIFGQAGNDTLKTTGYGKVGVDGVPMFFGSLFWGGQGDDTVTGTDTPPLSQSLGDFIAGGVGNDNISAGDGRDFVFGGQGTDVINGGSQDDFLFAGADNDIVHGNDARDIITGGSGDDTLYSDAGVFALILGNADKDTIYGGPGVDVELGNGDADDMHGSDGPVDILAGMQGADTISGENGVDLILGGPQNDRIYGGDGLDLVFAGVGLDYVEGGSGPDVIFGGPNLQNDNPQQFCTVYNLDTADRLYGNDGIDLIWGNSGCDAIYGGPGVNVLFGGPASDLIEGGPDTDFAWGNEGQDTINTNDGIDVAFGGPDNDVVTGGLNIDLLVGGAGNDHVSGGDGADIVIGSTGDDVLNGDNGPNLLIGGDGADVLNGGSSVDLAFGGNQDDVVNGGSGFNILFGDDGNDNLTGGSNPDAIFGDAGTDTINGGDGSNLLFGGGDDDTITATGSGFNIVFGGPGNDNLGGGSGGGSNNLLFGNAGDDTINAEPGRNVAFGGNDNDTMNGGCGSEAPRDYLFGNGGGSNNQLTGNKVNNRDILVGGTKTRC
jgi:Ca2+-binding RTX toxin-like protein